MYRLVRFWLKTACVFFILGLLTGLYLKGASLFGWPAAWSLVQAHTHVLLVGFMLMLIIDLLATRMFPRLLEEPATRPGPGGGRHPARPTGR
ncbi:MAG: DUF2871 family protein [Candidatus Sericytochromatia bacterium]|nr:DUF2871 family protein [Candidatus Sericytochromatia bacterium]